MHNTMWIKIIKLFSFYFAPSSGEIKDQTQQLIIIGPRILLEAL